MFKFIKSLFMPRGIKISAGELSAKFGLELRGNPKTVISAVAPIADAKAMQLTFYSTEKNSAAFKILPVSVLENTKAGIILLQPEQVVFAPSDTALLITKSPRADIIKILGEIYKEKPKFGIHWASHVERGVYFRKKRSVFIGQFATVERGAVLEPYVKIHPNAFIGKNVILGRGTIVHGGAHIENATIGENCVINANAVIGKNGFGFTRTDGKNVFIPHAGAVIIGDRVSIGAASCVDRGALTDTKIGNGTKIDNLCHIAHGVIIGAECFLASGAALAGGVIVGDRCMIGGNTSFAGGTKIGDDAEVGGHSGVFKNIPAGARVVGYPAISGVQFFRTHAWLNEQVKK